jgi:Na+-driven multidrug efflux pump
MNICRMSLGLRRILLLRTFFSYFNYNWNMPLVLIGANLNNKSQSNLTLFESLTMLGCVYFFGVDCNKGDISNAWSTWVGLAVGAAVGAVVTWWVYYRQKKISEKQDELLNHIADLEGRNKTILNKILSLEEKIEAMLEKRK